MKIKKVSFKKQDWSGVIGTADIEFEGGMTIKGMTLRSGDKGPWLSSPSRMGKDKTGATKYYPYIWMEPELNKLVTQAVINASTNKQTEEGLSF